MHIERLSSDAIVISDGTQTQRLFSIDEMEQDDTATDPRTVVLANQRTTIALDSVGELTWTRSVTEPVVFAGANGATSRSGVVLLSTDGADVRFRFVEAGFEVEVDNNQDGSVDHTFTVGLDELE